MATASPLMIDSVPALIQLLYLQCVEIRRLSGRSILAGAHRLTSTVSARASLSIRTELCDDGGRFINVDLRAAKTFKFGESMRLQTYIDLYNLFNVENLSLASRLALSTATAQGSFLQPVSLYGPGFGPPVGRPLTAQLGARFTF